MKVFLALVGFGVVASLGFGYFLVPAEREVSDGLVRDGENLAAKPLLESRYARGERGPRLLRGLAEVRIATGDVGGAEEVAAEAERAGYRIEGFEKVHLDAARASLDLARQRRLVEELPATPDVFRERAFVAALAGDRQAELRALEQLSGTGESSAAELLRLSLLLMAESRRVEAASILRRVDELTDAKGRGGLLRIEFELLAEEKGAEALLADRARTFLGSEPEPALIGKVCWMLGQVGRNDVSRTLLDGYREIVLRELPLLTLFASLLRAGKDVAALELLVEEKIRAGLNSDGERKWLLETILAERALMPVAARIIDSGRLQLDPPALERLAYAALSESGETALAESFLKHAAIRGGPDDRALRQLLYLWGPKPEAAAIDWLASRARAAVAKQRARWVAILNGVSAIGVALDLIEEWGWAEVPGISEEVEPLLWAAGAESSEASRILALVERHEQSPPRILRFAAIARGAKRLEVAARLAERSRTLSGPHEGAALLTLYGIASDRKDRDRAAAFARELFRKQLADDESLPAGQLASAAFEAALLARREGAREESKALLTRALKIARGGRADDVSPALLAQITLEVEGPAAAAGVLEEVSRGRALSASERALLARLLTQAGKLEEARAVVF